MFLFVIRYFGFLKFIPGLAILFDGWLKLWAFITHPDKLDWIDEIEAEVLTWDDTKTTTHKYGGLQLNYAGKEIGHIHSNGLLDMLLSRKLKEQLMLDTRVKDHHTFKNTGWISFFIRTKQDADYALELLRVGYAKATNNDVVIEFLPKVSV